MPRNKDIKKVLVIGSGPIIIGQAAEFDYAGTQACRSLKEEGIEVVLLNSNPATIMTDKDIADRVYIEPLTVEVVEQLILKEKPDSVLPTLGGQAGLNLAMELEEKGFLDHVIELEASTATVTEAAEALHVEPGMIAKTMSFLQNDKAVLILTEGTARVDNRKYKDTFHIKAKMIPFDEVENIIGHAPGGVCPFGINEGIEVYLDESLKQFTTVYPAAGNDHSAVKLTIPELEQVAEANGWVDVCKETEN